MRRIIMRAQLIEGKEAEGIAGLHDGQAVQSLLDNGVLMTAAVFKWKRNLFLYAEAIDDNTNLDMLQLFPDLTYCLEDWAGQDQKRKWIPMIDVFHFNDPASAEHWLRKESVERRVGRVAHLKPEMMSSYIYYHYQLQEEQAFHGPKYEIIAMHENLLFGYQEFPAVIEKPALPRKLHTSGTPSEWSDSRMDLHFQPWEDGHLYFKPIDTVFALYGHS